MGTTDERLRELANNMSPRGVECALVASELLRLKAAAAELIAALPAGALRNDQADARMAVIRLTELLAKGRHEPT